jgi:hypothetical protein
MRLRNIPWVTASLAVFLLTVISIVNMPGPVPKPPKTVYVNQKTYIVYFNATFPDDLKSGYTSKSILVGLTNCETRTIQIDPNQDLADLQDTLWHEAHHAANNCGSFTGEFESNPDFDYDDLYKEEIPEELDLIKNNPDLIRYVSYWKKPWWQ